MFEFDTTGIKPTSPGPAPEGMYFLRIVKAEMGVSKKEMPQAVLDVEIDDLNWGGKKIRHWVTFLPAGAPGAGMAVHFLKCLGVAIGGKVQLDPAGWVGRVIYAHVGIKGKYNEIVAVEPLPEGVARPADLPPPAPEAPVEEVPF